MCIIAHYRKGRTADKVIVRTFIFVATSCYNPIVSHMLITKLSRLSETNGFRFPVNVS